MENIKIIYEDDDVLVLNKPAGLSVHQTNLKSQIFRPRRTSLGPANLKNTVADWLIEKYPEIKKVGDDIKCRPGIVHRLDKDTSGVLIAAKNQASFEFLKKQFQDKEVRKTYLALVYGSVKNKEGIINIPLGRSRKDFQKRAVESTARGKLREAVTEYKVIKYRVFDSKKYTLLEVYPKTGRTHQIRVHLKAMGYPIVCDKLYAPKSFTRLDPGRSGGAVCPAGLERQFLHASVLELKLPGGSKIRFEAELPLDLQNVLSVLK